MAISKENLGVAIEEIKLSGDESYSSKADLNILSNKVDMINVAQKTAIDQGVKELLSSEITFTVNVAATDGTAVATILNQTIDLIDSIHDCDFVQFQLKINTPIRIIKSKANLISTPIVYNNTNVANLADTSFLCISLDMSTSYANSYGLLHFVLTGWFKTPTQFHIYSVYNPIKSADYNKISITSIQGIKSKHTTIDPVSYVNTAQGIEDAPVGNIITVIGENIPKHYLLYDNTELNILDYPDLAEYIKQEFGSYDYFGGDGINTFCVSDVPSTTNLLDVTPVMTSNTTPEPYSASALTWKDTRLPYKAFDNTNADTNKVYLMADRNRVGWLKLDFGKPQEISHFSLQAPSTVNTSTTTHMPKNFILYGSNDDIDYIQIKEFTQETSWAFNETRIYSLDNFFKYRYYRFEIVENNGFATYTIIPELRYLLNRRAETKCIKYEPTYFMNIQGLIEETPLWEGTKIFNCREGSMSAPHVIDESIILIDNIFNYDKIEFRYNWYNSSNGDNAHFESKQYYTKDIYVSNTVGQIILKLGYNYTLGIFGFLQENNRIQFVSTISDNISTTSGTGIRLTKIVGIKYKTFQNNIEGSES